MNTLLRICCAFAVIPYWWGICSGYYRWHAVSDKNPDSWVHAALYYMSIVLLFDCIHAVRAWVSAEPAPQMEEK